jgi:hypothetical protein
MLVRELLGISVLLALGAAIGLGSAAISAADRAVGSRLDGCPAVEVTHIPNMPRCSLTIYGELPADVQVSCAPQVFR